MRSRVTLASCFLLALAAASGAAELSQKVDPWVLDTASRGDTEFLVMLREQGDLRGARSLPSKVEKGAFVMDTLRSTADRSQRPLLDLLAERGAEHRSFWVANMVWVRGSLSLVQELATRSDVFHIYANPSVRFSGPVSSSPAPDAPSSPNAIEWGVAKVHAPEVWALGFTGQGIVVGGQDTGYDWTHPAIKNKYRGWNGTVGDHNYSWHDSIHSGGGVCGADSPEPCDDHFHGTHTMGTMVGAEGSNQIGVATGAKWIGCRNMDQGNGTPTTYSECFEWFIAPTNLAGQNPDPTKAPHVINNSWGCPPIEGCTDPAILQTVVENTRAAGIEVVVSAGNAGSSCGSVQDPPAIYDASFSVGATDISDDMAGFSSRGPVVVDGSNRMKPDISAPGVNVRSSVPGGGYGNFSGTSMAGPHVVGVVALVLSGRPGLLDDPDAIEAVLTASAAPLFTTESCGGVPADEIPNNIFGWGLADALAAFSEFLDVPPAHQFHDEVNTVARNGVTAGCGGGNFCPDVSVTRAQMAVFLLKSKFGALHTPPPATGTVFLDVPQGSFADGWIEELASLGVTGGCGGGNYCPNNPVTREQTAVFLLKTLLGSGYAPPVVAQIFDDVPPGAFAYDFINDLFNRGITGGCGGANYCPTFPNTRGQMAVFLVNTFTLQ